MRSPLTSRRLGRRFRRRSRDGIDLDSSVLIAAERGHLNWIGIYAHSRDVADVARRPKIRQSGGMTYIGKVLDGKVILPPEVVLVDGAEVFVQLVEQKNDDGLEDLLSEVAEMVQNLPPDLAAQHDHYIHGTPKR